MSAQPFNVLATLEFAGADINAAPGSVQHSLALVAQQHAALKANAARYLWLRDVSVPPHNFYISVPIEFTDVRYTPAEVDKAIDDAIAAKGAS